MTAKNIAMPTCHQLSPIIVNATQPQTHGAAVNPIFHA
jgi:hypothetical protein